MWSVSAARGLQVAMLVEGVLYGVLASLVSVLLAWPLVNILVKVCLYLFLF